MADQEKLYCFRLEDPSGEFEPATEMLDAIELPYSSYFERGNMSVIHTVYAETPADAEALLEKVKSLLPLWQEDMGIELIPGDIFELKKSDWADVWKKYFQPVEISPELLVSPAWMDPELKPGQQMLKIDTGMSFGTGQHPTTFYCLKKIDALADKVSSLLDAGCGSGILSVAALIKKISYVEGFDFDPDAVKMSEENLKLNGFAPENMLLQCGDAGNYPGRAEKYDMVCANILGHLLITFRFNIASWVKPGGYLVLAGILQRDFDQVAGNFVELGFTEVERETIGEWTGGLFVKNNG